MNLMLKIFLSFLVLSNGLYLQAFSGSTGTENDTHQTKVHKKIKVGNIIPDFRLADLDGYIAMISMQSLRGKYVLIHIWGTSCRACIMDMPYLHTAYERFKDKNFLIYSIARDRLENVQRFRNNPKYKMPWRHSIFDAEIINLLEIEGYPTQILVSPTGEILLVQIGTMGKRLEKILEETIEKTQ